MQICFYSPYIPKHFGGGEKHVLDVALVAARRHTVSIAISGTHTALKLQEIKSNYEKFYGSSLDTLLFVASPLGSSASFFSKLGWTKAFDALWYVTDGSLFFSLAKHNFLHIQIPFTHSLSFFDKLKLSNWKHSNTNSLFTKSIIEKYWKISVNTVLHPMVDIETFASDKKKQKVILHVGRFFKHLHSKRQDVLVQVFARLVQKYPKLMKAWQLQLVGSVEDESYLQEVKKLSKDLSVEISTKVSRKVLLEQYAHASIYWHATGYDVDIEKNPEKVEHFGITTLEAMASGTVPLVIGKGGQREVLGSLFEALSWETIDECVEKTKQLIEDENLYENMQEKVRKQAKRFDRSVFEQNVIQLFTV